MCGRWGALYGCGWFAHGVMFCFGWDVFFGWYDVCVLLVLMCLLLFVFGVCFCCCGMLRVLWFVAFWLVCVLLVCVVCLFLCCCFVGCVFCVMCLVGVV